MAPWAQTLTLPGMYFGFNVFHMYVSSGDTGKAYNKYT